MIAVVSYVNKERKLAQAVYWIDQCRLGRAGETCPACARQSRWAKRTVSRITRRAARQALRQAAR